MFGRQYGPKREGRNAIRRTVDVECGVFTEFWGEPVMHRVTDVSEEGLWIQTDLPLDTGTEVMLIFELDDWEEPLYVAARVRRVELRRRAGDPRSAGMGIQFEGMRADERRKLTRSLRHLRPQESPVLTQRTLLGVPVGEGDRSDRRAAPDGTVVGWHAPHEARDPAGKQDRRAPRSRHRSSEEPAIERDAAFLGGLALISSIFGDSED